MDDSQLLVFTHEYLGPQHLVETCDVNKVESGSNMLFICKNIRGAKLWSV